MYSSSPNKNHTAKALRRLSVLAGEANTVLELAFCHGTLIAVACTSARGRLGEVRPNDIAVRLAASVRTAAKVLAMKLHLLRMPMPVEASDQRDVEFFLETIKVSSPDRIQRIYFRAFPGDPLSETALQLINRSFQVRAVLRH